MFGKIFLLFGLNISLLLLLTSIGEETKKKIEEEEKVKQLEKIIREAMEKDEEE